MLEKESSSRKIHIIGREELPSGDRCVTREIMKDGVEMHACLATHLQLKY